MENSDFKKSQTPRTARGGVVSASERKDSWRTDSSPRTGSSHKDSWRRTGFSRKGSHHTDFSSRTGSGARVLGCAGVCAARVFLGAWIGPARIFRCAGVSPARVLGGLRARVAGAGIFGAGVTATGVGAAGITSAACEGVDEVRLVVAAPGLGGDVHPGSGLDGGWAYRFRPPVRQRGFHHVDAHVLAGGGAHAQIALAVAGDLADEHDGLAPRPGRAARTGLHGLPPQGFFAALAHGFAPQGFFAAFAHGFRPQGFLAHGFFAAQGFLAQGFLAHGFFAAHGFLAQGFFAHGLDAQGFFAHGFAAWAGRAAQSEAMRSAANRMNHDFLSIILPPWRDNCDTNFRRPLFFEFWVLVEPMDCKIHERFAPGKMIVCSTRYA